MNSIINSLLFRELDPAFARRAGIIARSIEDKGKEYILEVGCGRGFYEWFLPTVYPSIRMMAIDRNPQYISQAQKNVHSDRVFFQVDDAMNLSFKKSTFDRIIATEVLEHVPNDEQTLNEFYRVLKPGGEAVITVPNKQYPFFWDPINWILERTFGIHIPSHIWFAAGIWADHVRLYDEDELVKKCKATGFKVTKIYRSTHHCMPFIHFLLYGIGKNIVEKGFLPAFHRFSWNAPPSRFFRLIRKVIYLFDQNNKESEAKGVSTLNLCLVLKKN